LVKEGDVVIVFEESTPRGKWKLGHFRGGSREKSDQGSTKSSWAWLYGCGKYLRTINKKGQLVRLLLLT